MTDEKSHTEAAEPHGASQATDTRKNATCALSGQEKRSGGYLDPITATRATAGQFGHPADGGLIEREARAAVGRAIARLQKFSEAAPRQAWDAVVAEEILAAIRAAQDGAETETEAELRRALAQIESLNAECECRRAERDALEAEVERLREALTGLECACEQLAATRTHEVYLAMIDSGQGDALISLDVRRQSARAALRAEQKGDA